MKSSYHAIVFDRPPVDFGELEDSGDVKAVEKAEKEHLKKYPFAGEIHKFEKKLDLTQWLNLQGVKTHTNDYLAGRCMLELEDGRACVILYGELKILQTKVSVR